MLRVRNSERDLSSWAAYVRTLLDARGERPADFARAVGINNSIVSRWMTSAAAPDLPTLRRIAEGTGVPLLELLVHAGHLAPAEAQITTQLSAVPKPVTVEEAIEADEGIPEHHREVLTAIMRVVREQMGGDPWRRDRERRRLSEA